MDTGSELPTEAGEGDYVLLRSMSDVKYRVDKDYRLSITRVCEKYLEVRTPDSFRKLLDEKPLYEVKFRKDRTVFRFEQQAIATIDERVISKALFPTVCGEAADPSMTFDWLSNAVKTNPEQQQAVRNIVNGSAFPAPYILFGPPGTGKTTTLVEAIAQVWKEKPETHILVCASSNYACNEILTRLLDLECVPETEILRYLAKSQLRKLDTIEDRILEVSNINKQHIFTNPPIEELVKYRIIFLTLVTAGRLALNGMGTDHFDYIFIDEAGSATEASTLIPIAGLVSFGGFKKVRNHIVIAGDPKQLGPIVVNRSAEKLQYGRSLLDRLMELDLYKPDPETKQYNAACLTKLLQNFRSHKNILDIPNRLFYDNQLIAKARPEITDLALGKRFLPNKKIPIIFHAVFGKTEREADNPSLFNRDECNVVMQYVRSALGMRDGDSTLSPQEIGIISPYRKQCLELSKMLRMRMKMTDIEVGSVEQFQGQERKVIILSTVRSFTDSIGFLNNPKRLNVSITRAKALLIIVGNPITLQLDNNWRELIKYCVENKVCTGGRFSVKKQKRGRFRNKKQDKGIHITAPTNDTPIVNGQLKSDSKQTKPKKINITPSTSLIKSKENLTEDSSSSVSLVSEIESIDEPSTSDIVSDFESLSVFPDESSFEMVSNDIPDDDFECNFNGDFHPGVEDTYTSDDEIFDNEQIPCDINDITLLDETVTDQFELKSDNFDFDSHFDSFGFT